MLQDKEESAREEIQAKDSALAAANSLQLELQRARDALQNDVSPYTNRSQPPEVHE